MGYKKLLIDDNPVFVLPKLAIAFGLNEAIFLQQLHYWLQGRFAKNFDGRDWIYNTYEDWQNQVPFWSVRTIRRTVNSLVKQKVLIRGNFNAKKFDKTFWYTIDYKMLEKKLKSLESVENSEPSKMDTSKWTKWTYGSVQNGHMDVDKVATPIPDNTHIIPNNTRYCLASKTPPLPYAEIIAYLNEKADKKYKASTPKTKNLIRARMNEGFSLEDFKRVIDNKVSEWKGDAKMDQYLRPQTLFGTKFESYLNTDIKNIKNSETSDEDAEFFNKLLKQGGIDDTWRK